MYLLNQIAFGYISNSLLIINLQASKIFIQIWTNLELVFELMYSVLDHDTHSFLLETILIILIPIALSIWNKDYAELSEFDNKTILIEVLKVKILFPIIIVLVVIATIMKGIESVYLSLIVNSIWIILLIYILTVYFNVYLWVNNSKSKRDFRLRYLKNTNPENLNSVYRDIWRTEKLETSIEVSVSKIFRDKLNELYKNPIVENYRDMNSLIISYKENLEHRDTFVFIETMLEILLNIQNHIIITETNEKDHGDFRIYQFQIESNINDILENIPNINLQINQFIHKFNQILTSNKSEDDQMLKRDSMSMIVYRDDMLDVLVTVIFASLSKNDSKRIVDIPRNWKLKANIVNISIIHIKLFKHLIDFIRRIYVNKALINCSKNVFRHIIDDINDQQLVQFILVLENSSKDNLSHRIEDILNFKFELHRITVTKYGPSTRKLTDIRLNRIQNTATILLNMLPRLGYSSDELCNVSKEIKKVIDRDDTKEGFTDMHLLVEIIMDNLNNQT